MKANLTHQPETLKSETNRHFFTHCDFKISRMTLKTIGHPFDPTSSFVYHFKAYVNLNWGYSPETPNLGQIAFFGSRVTSKFWRIILENNWAPHLCYFKLSASFYFKPIGEFNLELQSWNAQFGSKLAIYDPFELEIGQMTLKRNRAPPLCYLKFCALFQNRWWNQTGATVRKCSILD